MLNKLRNMLLFSQTRILMKNCQVVNHLLGSYVTDDIIKQTDRDIICDMRPWNLFLLEFDDELWFNTLISPHTELWQLRPQRRLLR